MTDAERRLAAIMFTDLVGYTAQTQDNESLALAALQEHAEMLRPIFVKHGGREVKMIGDSFLVEFSSALSATLCAIDIQRRLYEHNVSNKTGRIELRIGIHVGDVVYRGTDVLGDAVNIASRIEPLSSPGSICISQQVYDQVWNKIENPIAGLGKHELKNVQIPIEVYRIVLPWEKEAAEGEAKRVLPLVDRTSELARLELMLERAIQGEGSLAFVAGEAGVGKTRLAEELSALARQKHVTTLLGRCSRREGKIPYAPWIEQIREFVRSSPAQMLYKVVGNYASDVAKLVPEVTSLIGPVMTVSAGSADQDRLRFIDGVTQLVVNMSQEDPVLLVMDDANWADSGSLDLLLSAARRTKNNGILILGIYRDVEVEEDSELFQFLYEVNREKLGDHVTVKGFDAEDTGKMMAEILNQDDVDKEFRDLVYRKTGGNPFFIEEVMQSLVEQGVVFRTAKGWERKPISEIEIPSGVRTVIKQRLSNLDPESQNVLSVASVTSSESKEFSFALLQIVTGVDENHLVDIMERILKARLVKETRLAAGLPGFSFTDARIRDAIYEEMTMLRRGRYHLKAAQGIEELYKDRIEDVYGVLVYHYLKGNDPKKCLEYSIKAAHKASGVYAHGEAIKYLKIALDVLEESPDKALKATVLEELGDSSWFAGRPDFQKYSEEAAKLCVENNEKRRAAHIYRELAEEMFDSNRENHAVPKEYYERASKLL
jgi:predicted ATPase/class 3 adenylate cyclase